MRLTWLTGWGYTARRTLSALSAVLLAACVTDAVTGPVRQPPYLAIVMQVDAAPEVSTGGPYTFRVRELSGTIKFDTTFRATARDTVIIPVAAATYRVDIAGVPPTCGVRDGTAQAIVVPPNTNTSLIRFSLNCAPALVVAAYADGFAVDSEFVVTVQDTAGKELASVLPANDTIRLDGIAPGRYNVTLRHVSENCVVISDGGLVVPVIIRPAGGAFVPFRVVCSEPVRRPRIALLAGSYRDGTIGYVIRATDPDKDIERTFVDVTDCNQRSVLTGGGRRRGGFGGQPNVTGRDTAIIVGAYDLDMADSLLATRCLGAWVADNRGNTSMFVEIPLTRSDAVRRPAIGPFNARRNGTKSIIVDAQIRDPDSDYVGFFAVYLLRDGVLSASDGQPDRVVLQPAGALGFTIPEFLVNIGLGNWNDYFGTILYAFDRAGNFTRVQDLTLEL
jgi:hypothetical protein